MIMGQPLSFSYDFMAEGKPAVKAFSGQRTRCQTLALFFSFMSLRPNYS